MNQTRNDMTYFLTQSPLAKKLRQFEYSELSMLCYNLSGQVTMKIKCTRKAGTSATYSYAATISGGRFTFVVYIPSTETFSLLSKLEVWAEYGGSLASNTHTYWIDETPRRDPVRVGWVNQLGGADYYTFTGAKTAEVVTDKTQYQRDISPIAAGSRSLSVGAVSAYDEYEIISDFEPGENLQWLSGLLTSPEVWVVESSVAVPVIITTKTHPVKSDNLFQMKIKYRYSFDKLIQNG